MQQKYEGSPLSPAIMVHFYRGVMDLSTTWRGRIDTTTNWAVVSSGSIASFVLSDREHSHIMALLGMFLTFAFLVIEARRFRFYDLWSAWIRLAETEYYEPLLRANVVDPKQQWHILLQQDLDNPHFKITWSELMGRRLRHNYLAVFAFLLLTWATKLLLHPTPASLGLALRTMGERAALGPIGGRLVVTAVAVFYSYLLLLVVLTPKLNNTGSEILQRSLLLRHMVNPSARTVGFKQYRPTPRATHPQQAPEED